MKKLLFIFFSLILFTNVSYASFPVFDTLKVKQDTLQTKEVRQYHSKLVKMGVDLNDCRCESCRKSIKLLKKVEEKSIAKAIEEVLNGSSKRPLHNISLNLFGDASKLSINYERQYLVGKSNILSTKFGLGYNQEFCISLWGISCSPIEDYLTIPHHFTANIGKRRSFFEFGLGGTVLYGETRWPYILYGIIGYRFLPLQSNKLNFRIYLQPPIPIRKIKKPVDNDFPHPDILYIPIGVSVGFSF